MNELNDILESMKEANTEYIGEAHELADGVLLVLIELLKKQTTKEDQAVIDEIVKIYTNMPKWFE